jgi:hypothetical protein
MRPIHVRRALLLLDALFKALAARGHVVHMKSWGTPPSPSLTVTVAGQGDLHIRVEEKLADAPHIPTADEREKHEKWGWRLKKYDQIPNGHLIFKVEGANWQYRGPKSWSDTKRRHMEDLLGNVIATIEAVADFNHRENVEMQARLRVAEEQERRKLRGERLGQWRRWLATDLEEMAANWETARRVSDFLDAFEKSLPEGPTPPAAEWLAAARKFAVRVDPLSAPASVAKDLEPSDETLAVFAAEQQRRNAPIAQDGRAGGHPA